MRWWSDLKVKTKTLLLVADAVAAVVVSVGTGLYKMHVLAQDEGDLGVAATQIGELNGAVQAVMEGSAETAAPPPRPFDRSSAGAGFSAHACRFRVELQCNTASAQRFRSLTRCRKC